MSDIMRIGFLPLVDAALPILARKLGMGEEEGLALDLVRDMSWATVRDRLVYGRTDAAHLLAPLAIATTLGLPAPAPPLAPSCASASSTDTRTTVTSSNIGCAAAAPRPTISTS